MPYDLLPLSICMKQVRQARRATPVQRNGMRFGATGVDDQTSTKPWLRTLLSRPRPWGDSASSLLAWLHSSLTC